MEQYIGTKIINAEPMTRQAYNDFRGWTLSEGENGEDEGYLVEYVDGGKANTEQFKGYVSWSPKDVFERSYHKTQRNNFDFSFALKALLAGRKITRSGWNGKDQFVYYVPANTYKAQTEAALETFGENVFYRAYFALKTVQNDVAVWVPSVSDILAEDWLIEA